MTVELAAQRLGEGPPLIVLHGLFGSGRNWTAVSRKLAERRSVHLLDLRNHGESPWHAEMSYPLLAADVAAYMDREGIAQAEIMGHSMGGKTAMTLALNEPERVTTLVVVDIAPVAYAHSHDGLVASLRGLDLGSLGRRAEADERLLEAIPDSVIRGFLLQNLVTRDGGFAWRLNLAAIADCMAALLTFPEPDPGAFYDDPTLFLGGAESDYVLPEYRPAILNRFPSAEIDHLEGTGHWPHAEQPAAFLERVSDFLELR